MLLISLETVLWLESVKFPSTTNIASLDKEILWNQVVFKSLVNLNLDILKPVIPIIIYATFSSTTSIVLPKNVVEISPIIFRGSFL